MCPINVEKSFSKLYHEPLTEKTDFGALESTVCVIVADFKRLRSLVAVLVVDSERLKLEESRANASMAHTPLQLFFF